MRRPRRRRITAALTLVLALVAAGVFTAPVQAAPPKPKPARDLPALNSPPPTPHTPEVPQPGDFSNPPGPGGPSARPSAFDPARSTPLDAETSPTRRAYRNPDGTRSDVVSAGPVRFRDGTGAWRDIDTAVVSGPNNSLVAKAAPQAARLTPRATGTVATVDTPAGAIGLRHPQAGDATAALDKDKATYKGALGGRDLTLALTAGGFKESVVLPRPGMPSSYVEEFVLPAGMTARGVPAGVEFLDAAGAVIATYGDGMAFDASFATGDQRSLAPVTTRLVSLTSASAERPAVATVEVAADAAWLGDPARSYPVTIDPTFSQNTAPPSTAMDTMIYSGAWANTSFGTSALLYTGLFNGSIGRSMLKFDLSGIPVDSTWSVASASLSLYNAGYGSACVPKRTNLYGRVAGVSNATTWNTRGTDATTVSSHLDSMRSNLSGTACYGGAWDHYDVRALSESWLRGSLANNGVELRAANEADTASFKLYGSGDSTSVPWLIITYTHPPSMATAVAPADGAVVPTATPTFSINASSDVDAGETVSYWYRATTSPEAESGYKAIDSGWTTATSYTAPPGALADGVTYYWHVWTTDGVVYTPPNWARSFQVELRLGDKGPFPRDRVGPAQVNLVNGNLVVRASSPAFPTVDGPLGLSYVYNSQAPRPAGLRGTYFPDPTASADFTGKTAVMSRRDPTVNFYWQGTGPGADMALTNFLVRWEGFLTAPTTGSYKLRVVHDDRIRIWVNGTQVINRWSANESNTLGLDTSTFSLTQNTPVSIKVEYFQAGGDAVVDLMAVGPLVGGTGPMANLPPDWLSSDGEALPEGWTLAPGKLSYTSAQVADRSVTFVDTSGAAHTHQWQDGAFRPPPEEDSVAGMTRSGAVTLHADDGLTYAFEPDGRLSKASAPTDDADSSAATYNWDALTNKPHRLHTITDPVGARSITLNHKGHDTCPGSPPSGFDANAPEDMLCSVDYWDGTSTKFWYKSGQLARIEDPGGAINDFSYDIDGRMVSLRGALAADWVAIDPTNRDNDTARTVVVYETGTQRVASVTLPEPSPSTARPATTTTTTTSWARPKCTSTGSASPTAMPARPPSPRTPRAPR